MTYEELKAEAKAQGYKLVKAQKYVPLFNCPVCGEHPKLWHRGDEESYQCRECGVEGPWKDSERQARLAWNKVAGDKFVEDLKE